MNIKTSSAINGDYYGKNEYKPSLNQYKFTPLGKKVTLEEIFESIESGDNIMLLSWIFQGRQKLMRINRSQLVDIKLSDVLVNQGADITRSLFNVFVDSIRIQEEILEKNGIQPTPVYSNLGWIDKPIYDINGNHTGFERCFRLNELIGSSTPAKYIGNFDVRPIGDYSVWQNMVKEHIVGHPVLELILIASLSSIPLGLIADEIRAENPIIHLNLPSSKGKTTSALLAASPFGKGFDGVVKDYDEYLQPIKRCSLFQSWGATDNAMVLSLSGNCGVVTILNELGKYLGKNMERLIFDFSEGSDKKRATKDLEMRLSERYSTVFISTGESSLLEKCKSKLEGLQVRVMEIDQPITDSAEHSDIIKNICMQNCGFAAPMIAEHILKNGGSDYVLALYNNWKKSLTQEMPTLCGTERFIEKFAALFLATADIATEALGIEFDKGGLKKFLLDYDKDNSSKRNSSAESYEVIISECQINRSKFYTRKGKHLPTAEDEIIREAWGRITQADYKLSDNRRVVEEFEVVPKVVEKILADNHFDNIKTCFKAWKEADVVTFEEGRRHQRLCIVPGSKSKAPYFVFRVFGEVADTTSPSSKSKQIANSNLKSLLADDSEEDNDNE